MPTMQKSAVIVIALLVLALVLGGYFAWQEITGLSDQVSSLGGQVEGLGERLTETEEQAQEAEARADLAEEDAEAALKEAIKAREEEALSKEQAAAAERDRKEALEREQAAAEAKRLAEERADEAAAARAEAEEKAAAVERREAELILKVGEAQSEARAAKAEAERLEKRMEREKNRLERALGQIAETRREALGLTLTLDDSAIRFDPDEANLRPEHREVLSRIIGVLTTFEDFAVHVVGHTDDVNTEEYNQDLSERRAQAVHDYLVDAGIDEAVLSTEGKGETSPLVEGTDDASRQKNRRVELLITFSEGAYDSLVAEGELSGEVPEPAAAPEG